MRLYLVQHGEAKSEAEDPDRSLTDKGAAEVRRVGEFLKPLELSVAAVWQSGKTRATQTAAILAGALSAEEGVVLHGGLGPNDPVEPIIQEIISHPGDLMIVGHLPFMGKLASALVAGSPDEQVVAFQQGGVVCIERDADDVRRVRWMVTPDLLR